MQKHGKLSLTLCWGFPHFAAFWDTIFVKYLVLAAFFFPVGFKRINIFLQIKLVFCLFNFPGGCNKVDGSGWTVGGCSGSLLISAPHHVAVLHVVGSRHRIWDESSRDLKLVSVLVLRHTHSLSLLLPLPPLPPSLFLSLWHLIRPKADLSSGATLLS